GVQTLAPDFIFTNDSGEQAIVLGKPQHPQSGTLVMHPNPASNELEILPGLSGTARLFDLLGREVLETNDDGMGTSIDVSKLEAGTYFLRLGTQSAKILIAR
ncbi:MAG TPA: T9SS type A sorting domain-containing protein, partial [Candidatus Kapabacteria bacterium]